MTAVMIGVGGLFQQREADCGPGGAICRSFIQES